MHKPSFNISSFIDDLIPEHIVTSYPELIEFIKVYALFLERENSSGFYLNQLDHQRDIDLIEDMLLNELQNEIGIAVPRTFAADPRLFYKHLVEFYQTRGTPESIEAFFKFIHNEDVEIYFPVTDILAASDGRWVDNSAAIIADPSLYTPVNIWTGLTPTDLIDFTDNNGFLPTIDSNIIYVNDQYDPTAVQLANGNLQFTGNLPLNSKVEIYKRGVFTTVDGMPDELKYLQDSYFYQKFSYVLRTGVKIEDWKDAFSRLVHPAGFIFFGEIYVFVTILDKGMPSLQPGTQDGGLPWKIFIPIVDYGTIIDTTNTQKVEKEFAYDADVLTRFGAYDHFENTKFFNWRYIRDYRDIVIQDVINRNVNIHFGAQITIT
jgi:hypothetical protein